eukprot:GHVU01093479.1.p1 GENE.GHVU01093479.1~~GHVU01093479.1.p1  ORF type:complete len:133 (+),score=10.30 GHVU01093479.1:110-508(+)
MQGLNAGMLATTSPRVCITTCRQRGFKWAGIEHRNECYCDHNYPKHGRAHMADCTHLPCDDGSPCGAAFRISLYATSLHEGVTRNIQSGNYRAFLEEGHHEAQDGQHSSAHRRGSSANAVSIKEHHSAKVGA